MPTGVQHRLHHRVAARVHMVVARINVTTSVHRSVVRGILLLHMPIPPMRTMNLRVLQMLMLVVVVVLLLLAVCLSMRQQFHASLLVLVVCVCVLLLVMVIVGMLRLCVCVPPLPPLPPSLGGGRRRGKRVLFRVVRQVKDLVQLIEMVCVHLFPRTVPKCSGVFIKSRRNCHERRRGRASHHKDIGHIDPVAAAWSSAAAGCPSVVAYVSGPGGALAGVCVCVCVCVYALEFEEEAGDLMKLPLFLSTFCVCVCVCVYMAGYPQTRQSRVVSRVGLPVGGWDV